MTPSSVLDRLHIRTRQNCALRHFTAITRLLLAAGFLPPGLVKILGIPFTNLGIDHPVGYFFSAFHRAELWYHFVGWGQVAAAVMLLFPRTATLGAVLYFPIILNIAMVTTAIDFQGTQVITWLMTLACLYLLCWDYDRLKALLPSRLPRGGGVTASTWLRYPLAFASLAAAGFALLASLRVANLHQVGLPGMAGLAAAGAVFGLAATWHLRGMPVPE